MVSSDFRKDAREKLIGKWGKAVCITLVYFAFSFVVNLLLENTSGFANNVLSILSALVEVPLGFGLVVCFVKLYNNEDVNPFGVFSFGFDNFSKAWGIALRTLLKLIVPIILLVVSIVLISVGAVATTTSTLMLEETSTGASIFVVILGIILYFVSIVWLIVKSYYYQITQIIAAENPEMTAKDVVQRSKELMQNNRFRLFCLEFSFIGWALLAGLTFGIGVLWLAPYMQIAIISFYKNLINE